VSVAGEREDISGEKAQLKKEGVNQRMCHRCVGWQGQQERPRPTEEERAGAMDWAGSAGFEESFK
jgi:hypothetical protein